MKTVFINVCFDKVGGVKCATSYQDYCDTCPNKEFAVNRELILENESNSNSNECK